MSRNDPLFRSQNQSVRSIHNRGRRDSGRFGSSFWAAIDWFSWQRWLLAVVIAGILFVILLPFTLWFGFYLSSFSFVGSNYTANLASIQPNRIVDRNGELLAELLSSPTGSMKPEEVPESLKQVLLFIEDRNFYRHGGLHYPSILRAAIANFTQRGYSQGGSTITQQLARILLERREKTIFRKLREGALAFYLERNFSKDEILTAYMNLVYLGHGAVGFDLAARFYYDKTVDQLTFAEELSLASLPSAPERYSPLRNPDRLERKMDAVFNRMVESDFIEIDRSDYQRQKDLAIRNLNRSPLESYFGRRVNHAPYVAEYVRQRIIEILGSDYQFDSGLTIETTIDKRLQLSAREETLKLIREIQPRFPPVRIRDGRRIPLDQDEERIRLYYSEAGLGAFLMGMPPPNHGAMRLQSASIGIEPKSGGVLFMQGGTEFSAGNQLNRTIQMRRQTGSAIKPIVYSAGLESGAITAATPIDDTPIYVAGVPRSPDDPGYWLPGNITGSFEGRVPARRALAQSKNIPAIRVGQMVGADRLALQFRKFFYFTEREFVSRYRRDDTIAIGSLEMSPLEMALAYAVFANDGVLQRPFLIRRIVSSEGKVLYDGEGRDEFGLGLRERENRILPADVNAIMVSMMRDSVRYANTSLSGEIIGKTGTSNDYRDSWFVGATPGLSASVWVGYDNHGYSMPGATGSSAAGPLWGRIVRRAHRIEGHFESESELIEVTVCSDSGELVRPGGCHRSHSELFTAENRPSVPCPLHDPERSTAPGFPSAGSERDDPPSIRKGDFF